MMSRLNRTNGPVAKHSGINSGMNCARVGEIVPDGSRYPSSWLSKSALSASSFQVLPADSFSATCGSFS
jgi:hypothetical protein